MSVHPYAHQTETLQLWGGELVEGTEHTAMTDSPGDPLWCLMADAASQCLSRDDATALVYALMTELADPTAFDAEESVVPDEINFYRHQFAEITHLRKCLHQEESNR